MNKLQEKDTWQMDRELKGHGTFFDELCLLMIGFDRGQRLGWITQ
jgi:hypothetical protein